MSEPPTNLTFCMYLHSDRLPAGPCRRFKGDPLPVLVMREPIDDRTMPDAFPDLSVFTKTGRRVGELHIDVDGVLVESFGGRYQFAFNLLALARAEHPFIAWRFALTKGDRPTAYGVINGGVVVALVCAVQTWGQPMNPELLDERAALPA